jgi:glycosyltransferase involved in cell wall biosynthesis
MKILFVSHSSIRTGAPLLLLNIGKLLKETGKYEVMILLKNGGELETDFSKIGETYVWSSYFPNHKYRNILQRVVYKFYLRKSEEKKRNNLLIKLRESDVIINNTITNGELLEDLTKGYKGKVVSYIHELQFSTSKFATARGVDLTMKLSHAFITPCFAVKHYLENTYKISQSKITVLNSYIPPIGSFLNLIQPKSKKEVLTVGCSGTADLRKGFDIFILLAKYILSQNFQNPVKFIWKGVGLGNEFYTQGLLDIVRAGLDNVVTLVPADSNMDIFYDSIDVFLLLSREDPYPLVVLEAASFGKPTICFDNAGGAPEFVQNDAGSVVPYLDIPALANELLLYQSSPDLLSQKGNIAKERVRQKHQDKNIVLQQLHQILSD